MKAELRNPRPERGPKCEGAYSDTAPGARTFLSAASLAPTRALAFPSHVVADRNVRAPSGGSVRIRPMRRPNPWPRRAVFWNSEFGVRPSFDLRVSDFGFALAYGQ